MARKLEGVLREYLDQSGRLRRIQLGDHVGDDARPPRAVDPEAETLFGYARRRIRSYTTHLSLLTAATGFVVAFGIVGAALKARTPLVLAGILLGTLLVLLWLLMLTRRLMAERIALDLIAHALGDLPPDQTVRLIETIFWNRLWESGRQPPGLLQSPAGRRPAIEWDSFDVHLQPDRGRGPVVEARSSAGAHEDVLVLSSDLARQAADLSAMLQRCPAPGRHLVPMGPPIGIDVRSMGLSLFKSLPEGVRTLFNRAYGRTGTIVGRGLRIRVTYNPSHQETAALGALPWELLATPTEDYLGRRRLISILHTLEIPRPVDPPVRTSSLRILSVSSLPEGVRPLDLETELRQLESVWEQQPDVSVTSLRPPTLEALNEHLLDREIHVLHYMGHGAIGPSGGVLYLEDDDGAPVAVSGAQLADALEDVRSIRLVVVNACLSASSGPVEADPSGALVSNHPFASLATCLVQAGVTAVVAMQFAISDAAAIAFSKALYRRLAVGDSLDTAVTEGRRTLARQYKSLEWASPVLFLRAGDSRIFVPPEA